MEVDVAGTPKDSLGAVYDLEGAVDESPDMSMGVTPRPSSGEQPEALPTSPVEEEVDAAPDASAMVGVAADPVTSVVEADAAPGRASEEAGGVASGLGSGLPLPDRVAVDSVGFNFRYIEERALMSAADAAAVAVEEDVADDPPGVPHFETAGWFLHVRSQGRTRDPCSGRFLMDLVPED
eukprot:GHVU01063194.1.p1 GENE.GHVU01063194.1~~GHVU01063194.1.p1  ORF type:complete len:180 (+),score=19.95 GHVU01063194.1:123-662(+)